MQRSNRYSFVIFLCLVIVAVIFYLDRSDYKEQRIESRPRQLLFPVPIQDPAIGRDRGTENSLRPRPGYETESHRGRHDVDDKARPRSNRRPPAGRKRS